MSSEFAIEVVDLSKCYEIYNNPSDRLKQMLARGRRQYYKEFWALKDVSFKIKKGETVGIIGRNGSGKSTLLQMICGTLNPTRGEVKVNGRVAALLELGAGFNPEFTGRENVYLSSSLLGLDNDEIDARYESIASFADIGEFIDQPVKTYSSGMFVRLAFAVNIMSTPEIMVVDEALAVGDMAFQAKCMTALTRIQDQGATVLFVSHDMDSLKSLCTRGVYLEKGALKLIGQAGLVADQYIRTIRDEINSTISVREENINENNTDVSLSRDNISHSENVNGFKISTEFAKRVNSFRYGDGGVRVTYAEIVDDGGEEISLVEFDQPITINIYIESLLDEEIGCNYYVLDAKRNLILGASLNLLRINAPSMSVSAGKKYLVSYKTKLPLHEGVHSIQLQIVRPTVRDDIVTFLDVIDNAIVFQMARRAGARIWAKAYIENKVEIRCY